MSRCKNCKEKFNPKAFLQKYCMEKDECVKAFMEYRKIELRKKYKRELKEMKIEVYGKENKKYLQSEINKLSRMIDSRFKFDACIDCNKPFGKQVDACHFHSRGANSSLKYNLDNLHSGRSDCNQYSENHKSGYKIGLIERYGKKYTQYVVEELPLKYPLIKLTAQEIYEKLALVRKLIRTFDAFDFKDSLDARKKLNKIIGIYK